MAKKKNTDMEAIKDDAIPADTKNVIQAEITEEMQKAFLDYAMSVIVSRALPDVRDGLKPVQRRIIYAMQDQGVTHDKKFQKSAAVVGEVLKKYHPHGDTSVYEAMVRMAQDFSLRYPLVNGQGNFGSVDGDAPAAMRYTEAKLQQLADELFRDIEKETVPYEMNDLQNLEPVVLPSVLPNLLLNGASGIAVGMATNIPPHNLEEIIDGIHLLIENAETIGAAPAKSAKPKEFRAFDSEEGKFTASIATTDFASSSNVEDLIQIIKGPDFPTGGTIYDHKEITHMYATGKGRVVQRAKMDIEEMKNGRMRIVVTEIPYQVNKATLVEKIAAHAKAKKIEGISDLRDESNREGMRVVIELKKAAVPQKVQNRLYKYTPLQQTFNANMVALLDGEPKLMTLKVILEEFIKHRQIVIVNRTLFLLKKVKAREHILEGLKKAIDNIDEVIATIKKSKDVETARAALIKRFDLTSIQAQAILDMQLRRLAALEIKKIEEELKAIQEIIGNYESILASPEKIITIVKDELSAIKEKYGNGRKTKVVKGVVGKLSDEDLVKQEKCFVTISKGGYIKRLKEDTYKQQGRGGKGVKGQELKEEDVIANIRTCNTHDYAFFFTNKGKVYKMRIWEIPESSRRAKGTAMVNFLSIGQNESIEAFLTLSAEELEKGEGFVVFGTQKGRIKKTSLADYSNIRTSGIMAIKLSDEDTLAWARFSSGNDDIMIVTSEGQSIRFSEKDVRAMGRVAAGVGGIRLKKKDDTVVGMVVLPKNAKDDFLVVVSEKGYGKKTPVGGYKVQNRSGSGIKTYSVTAKTGKLVTARTQAKGTESDMLIVTNTGQVIRLDTKSVPKLGRDTMGVKLINLGNRDKVASVAKIEDEEVAKIVQELEE
jgi:DNA gyrase subunit A